MLELAAAAGEIDLKYLDESGFCLWSSSGYTYYPRGEQKRLEQTKRRGRRLSILGLLQPFISFVYGLVVGSVGSHSYITLMENEAQQAELEMLLTGRIRVIVQDNSSIHKSQDVQQKLLKWESQGLYIFFLPENCSEMNNIELEWQQLKNHELAGRMFEDELELAYAVMEGIEARGQRGNYRIERFKFNSHSFC